MVPDALHLITKTHLVTFTIAEIGWYAEHVNANDSATMGVHPRWFQACLLFLLGTTEETVHQGFTQIEAANKELSIAVTGGHTAVTNAVTRLVVIGDRHGLVDKDRLVTASGARPGDLVVMTKTVGSEGTRILVVEKVADLRPYLDESLLQKAVRLRHTPGIAVVKEALRAADHGASAIHDPTEGGVAMGL